MDLCHLKKLGVGTTISKIQREKSNNETVSRTHRVLLIGCLTEPIWTPRFEFGTLTTNTRSQTFWPKHTSHVTNGITFFVCSTSAISALFAAPKNFSLISCITERMAKRMQEQSEENRIVAKSRPTAMNLSQFSCYKFFICEQSDCVEEPGDTQGLKSADWIIRRLDANANQNSNPTQRRVFKYGKEMLNCSSAQGNL